MSDRTQALAKPGRLQARTLVALFIVGFGALAIQLQVSDQAAVITLALVVVTSFVCLVGLAIRVQSPPSARAGLTALAATRWWSDSVAPATGWPTMIVRVLMTVAFVGWVASSLVFFVA